MERTSSAKDRPLRGRAAADQVFRDLLIEAYRERAALLRGRGQLIFDTPDMHADDPRRAIERTDEQESSQPDMGRSRPCLVDRQDASERLEVVAGPRLSATDDDDGDSATCGPETGCSASESARSLPGMAEQLAAATTKISAQVARHSALVVQHSAILSGRLAAVARQSKALARNVADAFVPSPDQQSDHDIALQQLWRRGLTLIAVFAGFMALWSIATTVSSAVVAPGQFVVDTNVKKIQHPTGGVVGQLLVREGDRVAEGDLLIRLDETVARANLQVLVNQLDELASRKARLEAERDGKDAPAFLPQLLARSADANVARAIGAEQGLFQARRATRDSQRAQLTKRIAQLNEEISGLRSQREANARETQIISEELVGLRELYKKNLTPIMRLNALERQAVNLEGQRGQLTASIAQIEGKIAETELQIMQMAEDLRAETQKELRDVQDKTAELSERRVAAEDQLKRLELRTPIDGYVHQLSVHTVGGVITPGEPIMLIVPVREELVLEARVLPQDRDQLEINQKAAVRVSSSNRRNTPDLNGVVKRISADVSKETGSAATFYTARIAIPGEEIARLRGVQVAAGMQAEVFIEVGARTPLEYLLQPLLDLTSRAFRER